MVDKAVQVAIGSKRPRQTSPAYTPVPKIQKEERATQCGMSQIGSYGRNYQHKKLQVSGVPVQFLYVE